MNKFLLLILAFISVVILVSVSSLDFQSFKLKQSDSQIVKGKIGETTLTLEIFNTPFKRSKGLSGREVFTEGQGALFVFPKVGNYGFWMKEMNFPIDIIWINNELKIIGIEKNIKPDTYPASFYPPGEIQFTLEVPGGYSDRQRLNIGNQLILESQNLVLERTF